MERDQRVARWVDIVGQLLQRPLTVFPHQLLAEELMSTFDTCAVSWNWVTGGAHGFELFTELDWQLTPDQELELVSGRLLRRHPLIQWFGVSGSTSAQTMSRVPEQILTPRSREQTIELLAGTGIDQQLSLPYEIGPAQHLAFVVSRIGTDFTEDDVQVACRLQPLLRGLSRQVDALRWSPGPASPIELVRGTGLTQSELAVLRLLAEGHTAYGIGQRLCCSPRTVHKHLEHVYRKLGVSDRLGAVHAAEAIGVVEPPLLKQR